MELVRNLMHPVPEMRPSASQLLKVREYHGLDIAHTVTSLSRYLTCLRVLDIFKESIIKLSRLAGYLTTLHSKELINLFRI